MFKQKSQHDSKMIKFLTPVSAVWLNTDYIVQAEMPRDVSKGKGKYGYSVQMSTREFFHSQTFESLDDAIDDFEQLIAAIRKA